MVHVLNIALLWERFLNYNGRLSSFSRFSRHPFAAAWKKHACKKRTKRKMWIFPVSSQCRGFQWPASVSYHHLGGSSFLPYTPHQQLLSAKSQFSSKKNFGSKTTESFNFRLSTLKTISLTGICSYHCKHFYLPCCHHPSCGRHLSPSESGHPVHLFNSFPALRRRRCHQDFLIYWTLKRSLDLRWLFDPVLHSSLDNLVSE